MIQSITVKDLSFLEDIFFFKTANFAQFDNRVVPLFGPNGVGKSTLIQSIEKQNLEINLTRPTLIFSYQNGRDNFKVREPRTYAEAFDPSFATARFDAKAISEGQSIIYSMFDLLDGFLKNGGLVPQEGKDIAVLLDEIDSGMSIDNIDITMRKIKYIVSHRTDVQFIMSFNSPRVVKHFPKVLSMYNGQMIELHNEDDMLDEINRHKKEFNKARKTSKGRPKIFN